jgi:hypothetical protein
LLHQTGSIYSDKWVNRVIYGEVAFLSLGFLLIIEDFPARELAVEIIKNHLINSLHFLLQLAVFFPESVKLGDPLQI